MSQDDDPQQIPTVEELDGEPRGDAPEFQQRTRTLEMVLGMLLLLGVLGYAGWQWWSTENSRSHYDQGRQAAQANHWDQARSQFAQAGGYKDSAALAEQAKAKIQERDLPRLLERPRWGDAARLPHPTTGAHRRTVNPQDTGHNTGQSLAPYS